MRQVMLPLRMFLTLLVICLLSGGAQAQASRTWVSGVGDDTNPCARTTPCKTFAGAISKTAVGGEINALDPGDFGTVTIAKGITIDGGGGQVAGVSASGTNGVVVTAGPTDIVTLRNLRINGIGSGLNGIVYQSGAALHIKNCNIFGFIGNGTTTGNGISVATSTTAALFVNNTFLTNNNNGIQIAPSAAFARSVFVQVQVN